MSSQYFGVLKQEDGNFEVSVGSMMNETLSQNKTTNFPKGSDPLLSIELRVPHPQLFGDSNVQKPVSGSFHHLRPSRTRTTIPLTPNSQKQQVAGQSWQGRLTLDHTLLGLTYLSGPEFVLEYYRPRHGSHGWV